MTESVLIERVFTKELESGLSPDGSGTHLVNQVQSGSVSLLFLSLERRAQLLLLLCFHQDWTSSTRHAYYQEIIASCAVSQAINSYLLTLEGELTPRGEKLLTLGSVTTTPVLATWDIRWAHCELTSSVIWCFDDERHGKSSLGGMSLPCAGSFGYPFQKCVADGAPRFLTSPSFHWADGESVAHVA